MTEQVRGHLEKYRSELLVIEPSRSNWGAVEAWETGFRLFLRRQLPQDLGDFDELTKGPRWFLPLHRPGSLPLEPVQNSEKAKTAKAKLLAFVETLLQLIEPEEVEAVPDPPQEVAGTATETVPYMPFRPYKRYVSRIIGIEDFATSIQLAALDGGAEEMELAVVGGRIAVLASIRRHKPSFDPAGAQMSNGPAWIALKPFLFRAGLPVGDDTTLTDIKAFLDDAPVPEENRPQETTPMPDPKRVFVIYGRNQAAYDEMVKFLRALGLDPKPFLEVSGECGANPTVLEIVRHGMEQAAGVVALFTPDEWAVLRPMHDPARRVSAESRRWQARPNVIFEAGLALGIAEARTIFVKLGADVDLFSDIGGIHLVCLDNGPESRGLLRDKLRAAGCDPNMKSVEFLNTSRAGDFVACVQFPDEQAPHDPFTEPTRRSPSKR